MATETTRSSNGFLYFIVGALVVGMIVLAFMFFGGADTNNGPIEGVAESVGEAADEVGDAARSPG